MIGLALLFPRVDPSASARLAVDRGQAIERVRQFASRYGLDTAGWRAAVTEETVPKAKAYLAAYPDDPSATLFRSLRLNVTLIEPGGRHRVRMVLFANGQPKEWRWDGAAPSLPGPAIDTVLADFLGANRESFHATGATQQDGTLRSTWNWHAAERFQLWTNLTIEQKAGVLQSATLAPVYGDRFDEDYKRGQKNTFAGVATGVAITVWTAGFVLFLVQLVRGRVRWRIPLLLLALQLVWAAFSFWGGTYYQEFLARKESSLDTLFFIAGQNSGTAFYCFWLFLFAGAGYVIRTAGNSEKWFSIELISRGKIFNRTVGQSLAVGMLGGIGLAAVPYLVAAIRPLSWLVDFRSTDALVAPSPVITALRLSAAVPALAIFGFLFPITRKLRNPIFFWMAFVIAAVPILASSAPFHTAAAALATGLVLFGGFLWIYRASDLLSVMVAMVAARAVVVPAVLLIQSLPSLRDAALAPVTFGVAAVVVALYWALRGPEPDAKPTPSIGLSSETDGPARSDRERLQAEFQVARKAQQDALPSAPPLLDGYSLAGWCEPAQQVGGDLYDFFPLPDGRLGVAVADVSGKGVPAALYMMVTKGLLSAVSRDSNQLAYILEQTNLHLYRACRRKVFVTLAAVVLDSSNRRLEYGRAGHNPIVWRRARRGETTLVKPPGLGLGMTPGERFNRSLRIEELDLEPDDAIVLYSDGVTEAVNHTMEQFGEERLMRSVESTDGRPAVESRDAILRDLADFMGSTPARDDITLVVIRA